jgi:hypothetical protein
MKDQLKETGEKSTERSKLLSWKCHSFRLWELFYHSK